MLTTDEISLFIQKDGTDSVKSQARLGRKYYEGEHDILDYRIFYVDAHGEVREDDSRSNMRISHPYFTELCDQQVQYMLSDSDGYIMAENDKDLQEALDEYFDEDFMGTMHDFLTDVVSLGFGYLYAYADEEGRIRFEAADSMGVIEVSAKDCEDGRNHVIYQYFDRYDRNNRPIYKVQVWDEEQTWYYVKRSDGTIVEDEEAEENPSPHVSWTGDDGSTFGEGFGFIPFFRLDNNRKMQSNLNVVKPIIDDYDLVNCGLSNNISDYDNPIYAVTGFQGENLEEMMTKLKAKRVVGLDVDGGIEVKTVDIPYEARKVKLEMDERNIYHFGMGLNSNMVGDGNVTNVVIKSRYALLDMKCNKLEVRLKKFLRVILDVVLNDINSAKGTDYKQRQVKLEFHREIMTNALDNAQIAKYEAETRETDVNTFLNLRSLIGDEEALRLVCENLDLDYEELKDKIPEDPLTSLSAARSALEGDGGGLSEPSGTGSAQAEPQ